MVPNSRAKTLMSGQEAEILPYHHPALPVDLANEISDILSVYGLGDVAMEPQATYQSLPSSPPSRRAGLEDVYLFSRVGKVEVAPGPVPLPDRAAGAGATPAAQPAGTVGS